MRPKTLTAAVIPIAAATALVYFEKLNVSYWVVGLSLFAALCIQIATNFINDAIDHEKGADTHERIGPQRVTQSGLLSRRQVFFIAGLFLIAALLAGIPLVYIGGWPIVIVGLVSLFLAYSYTGGPIPLAYLGLGDIFVVLFFGVIAVGGVYYLHTGFYKISALILGLQIGFLSTILIAINNLRDVSQDRQANKKTLAVRFGESFVRSEILCLLTATFMLQAYWFYVGERLPAILPFLFLPFGIRIINQILKAPPGPVYNQFLAQSALLHLGFGLTISLGFLFA